MAAVTTATQALPLGQVPDLGHGHMAGRGYGTKFCALELAQGWGRPASWQRSGACIHLLIIRACTFGMPNSSILLRDSYRTYLHVLVPGSNRGGPCYLISYTTIGYATGNLALYCTRVNKGCMKVYIRVCILMTDEGIVWLILYCFWCTYFTSGD